MLKGKFSSGREGAMASKFNYEIEQKQLSEVMLCIYLFLKVFNLYLSKIYTKTAEISKQVNCDFCTWASYFIMNYKITVKYMFWRKYLFHDAYHASIVSLLCNTLHKNYVALTDV